jgi:RimJ/RimL family protein N-acetyltransferase
VDRVGAGDGTRGRPTDGLKSAREVRQTHVVRPSGDELPSVRLREITKADDALLAALSTPESEGEWNTFDDPPEERIEGRHYGGGALVIELDDGTPVGVVTWIQIPHGPNRRSLAWNIGITVMPSFRGRRIGAAAQRDLADHLFARSDANRVMADTDVGNVAEQRSLERAGFTREGVARGAQWRQGAWHDRVIYARLRSD